MSRDLRGIFFGIFTAPNVHVFLQQMAPDQVVLLLVQDNIELACRAIEKRRWIVPLPMLTRILRHRTSSAGAIVRYCYASLFMKTFN